jgi:NAD+ kinase
MRKNKPVLALVEEADRLPVGTEAVGVSELMRRSDLLVSLGGDGTMLRALRMARLPGVPVLGVNLGRLGFLAEVDVPELAGALAAIELGQHAVESRVAILGQVGGVQRVAFNDFALVRRPGTGSALLAVHVDGEPFVRYAADAVVVSTPTGSTAYSFSAGGPIVSPRAQGLLVIPVAPHSAFNRAVFLSCAEPLALEVLPASGELAVEVDGQVVGDLVPGDWLNLGVDLSAGAVVRLGQRSFYARARRKLHLSDSAELV